MKPVLSDARIEALLAVGKSLSGEQRARLLGKGARKRNPAYSEALVDLIGDDGSRFRVHLQRRLGQQNVFSIQLVFVDTDDNEYRLIRLAGRWSSTHTNLLEREAGLPGARLARGFRVNRLTERYQRRVPEVEEDGFAEIADPECQDLVTGFDYFARLAGIRLPNAQPRLL